MSTYNPYEGRKNENIKVKYLINLPPDIKVTENSLLLTTPELYETTTDYFYEEPISLLVSEMLCFDIL